MQKFYLFRDYYRNQEGKNVALFIGLTTNIKFNLRNQSSMFQLRPNLESWVKIVDEHAHINNIESKQFRYGIKHSILEDYDTYEEAQEAYLYLIKQMKNISFFDYARKEIN